MKITKVTMTGADDSIAPEALHPISQKYPFVEWGILRSRSQNGSNRFPSQKWIKALNQSQSPASRLHLCAHLCGKYVREVLEDGNFEWLTEKNEFTNIYERIQVNFHAERHKVHHEFSEIISGNSDYEFIFQMDGTPHNERIFYDVLQAEANVVPLFDISGGIGAVPSVWPEPLPAVYCGYAGGLGPETIVEQLKKIEHVVGDREIWIDMETRIRSNHDSQFDLEKVVECLELAKPWTKEQPSRESGNDGK